MSKRIFTREQVDELSRNSSVRRCSERSITYDHEFKMLAVKKYEDEGLGAAQIFREAGFDLDVIGKDAPIDDVRRFLGGLETTVLSDLHETILANSYYLERRFTETCAAIEAELVVRGSAPEGTVRLGSGSPSEFAIPDGRHPNAIDHG